MSTSSGNRNNPRSINPGRPETENDRRLRSFVIIGLPEFPGSAAVKANEDYAAALDIVRYLGIQDAVDNNKVKRLNPNRRDQRHLMVTLESEASRDKLLSRTHFLELNDQTSHLRIEKAIAFQPTNNNTDRSRYSSNNEGLGSNDIPFDHSMENGPSADSQDGGRSNIAPRFLDNNNHNQDIYDRGQAADGPQRSNRSDTHVNNRRGQDGFRADTRPVAQNEPYFNSYGNQFMSNDRDNNRNASNSNQGQRGYNQNTYDNTEGWGNAPPTGYDWSEVPPPPPGYYTGNEWHDSRPDSMDNYDERRPYSEGVYDERAHDPRYNDRHMDGPGW